MKKAIDGAGIKKQQRKLIFYRLLLQRYVTKPRAESLHPGVSTKECLPQLKKLLKGLILSKHPHGLTTTATKVLVFEFAKKLTQEHNT